MQGLQTTFSIQNFKYVTLSMLNNSSAKVSYKVGGILIVGSMGKTPVTFCLKKLDSTITKAHVEHV